MLRTTQLALAHAAGMGAGVATLGMVPSAFLIPSAILVALLGDGIFRPASGVLMPTVTHGPREGNRIALTFDDGPDPVVTPAILDLLAEYGARATFYCIARHCLEHPELTRRIVEEGHELGNHSHDHSRTLNFRGAGFQEQELQRANAVLREFAPQQAAITYRPPVGLKNPPLAAVIEKLNMPVVAWSLHSRDTRLQTPRQISKRVLDLLKPGDIVLLHDGHDLPQGERPHTAAALREILQGMQAQGLVSVGVSELISRQAA